MVKVLIGVLLTLTLIDALLLPVFTGGSLPPVTVAVLVMAGTALAATETLMMIGLPVPPATMTLLDVQEIV